MPDHLLEYVFGCLSNEHGLWPPRQVLFSVCGVCKLWRRVGHQLFFSNVWSSHTDTIVHPSQLFTLSPHPLRLPTSDNLLRCFVRRAPCPASGLTPRLGRSWSFAMYLGADHRLLRPGGGGSAPQLLMSAVQAGRRSYQIMLSPALSSGSGAGRGGWGGAERHAPQWHGHERDGKERAAGGGAVVALLRSNLRCSHYQLLAEGSSPWARRLVSVAGYLPPLHGSPVPLISLEYRLRVRGIMLPRRMKVCVPVPHSLQRVVHNPLYDTHTLGPDQPHTPSGAAGGGARGSAWLQPAPAGQLPHHNPHLQNHNAGPGGVGAGGGGGAAAAAAPMQAGAAGPAGAGWALGGGGAAGGGAAMAAEVAPEVQPDGALMDHLEEAADPSARDQPLLFANMLDAAAERPAEEEAEDGGPNAPAGHVPHRPAGHGAGALRRFRSGLNLLLPSGLRRAHSAPAHRGAQAGAGGWGLGGVFRRGFLNRRQGYDAGAGWAVGERERSSAGDAGPGGGGLVPVAAPPPVPVVRLQNKAPHWNDALMCWCLNFRGRVKMASVKNFQLCADADPAGRCVMQFGKVEEGVYILDFNPCVLTAAQAFAAALSTFETKYLL